MSGWLTKAAGKLRGEQPDVPVPFESECQCGVRHSGLRRRKPQRIICRSCGSALFVLPRDSYPTPTAPPPKPKKKRRKNSVAEAEAPARFQQVATNVFQTSGQLGRSAAASAGSRLRIWVLAFAAIWTPLRLILLGCVAICAATVLYVLSSDRSEQAVMDLKSANEAARKALTAHQIDDAARHLTAAVVALDRLDRHDDPLAREIRQLNREAIAIRDSLPVSPLQIVAEAETAHAAGQGEQWDATFRTQYRGRWMIIDGTVRRNIAGPARGQHAVSLPIRFGKDGRGVELNVALAELDTLAKGGKPRRAVFAVQLEGCELARDKQTWKLATSHDKGFLWGTVANYEEAGFGFDVQDERQEVERLLATQRRILGLTAESDELAAAAARAPADSNRPEGVK